jgi:hypothetical protein
MYTSTLPNFNASLAGSILLKISGTVHKRIVSVSTKILIFSCNTIVFEPFVLSVILQKNVTVPKMHGKALKIVKVFLYIV